MAYDISVATLSSFTKTLGICTILDLLTQNSTDSNNSYSNSPRSNKPAESSNSFCRSRSSITIFDPFTENKSKFTQYLHANKIIARIAKFTLFDFDIPLCIYQIRNMIEIVISATTDRVIRKIQQEIPTNMDSSLHTSE